MMEQNNTHDETPIDVLTTLTRHKSVYDVTTADHVRTTGITLHPTYLNCTT